MQDGVENNIVALIEVLESFNEWLDEASTKFRIDKNKLQEIIKDVLL